MKYIQHTQKQGEKFFEEIIEIVTKNVNRSIEPSDNIHPISEMVFNLVIRKDLESTLSIFSESIVRKCIHHMCCDCNEEQVTPNMLEVLGRLGRIAQLMKALADAEEKSKGESNEDKTLG